MPAGPGPLGFAYFVGVKFVGYTAAAYSLRKVYPDFKAGIAKVGAARTAIGLVAGLAYGALWILLCSKVFRTQDPTFAYLLGLLPVRIAEWLLLLHLFFDRTLKDRQKAIKCAIAGSVWSYCLDAIGIGAALVIPGGIWVC
jgi:hypothetical protein